MKSNLETLLEQEKRILALEQLLREAMTLLPERPRIYTHVASSPEWHNEVTARLSWRARAAQALAAEQQED